MSMTTAEIVNAFLQRLDAGDIDGVGELFAEEIDWYVPGGDHLPWAGPRSRRAQVPEFFHHLESECETGDSAVTLEKVLIDGDDAVVFGTFHRTFVSTGRSFDNPEAMHLAVADGKIVRMHLYEDTGMVRDAFVD
jgi:ketosteroid isomerase-like protein